MVDSYSILAWNTAPPGQPHTLSVKESEATLFQVCWEASVQSDSHISYYLLRVCNLNSTQAEDDKVTATTISNDTFYSVTGLLPGTTYELTVVAVSQGGDVVARSQPSDPIVDKTGVTGYFLHCIHDITLNILSQANTVQLQFLNYSVMHQYHPMVQSLSSGSTSTLEGYL